MITIAVPVPICCITHMPSLVSSAVSAECVESLRPQTKPSGPKTWVSARLLYSGSSTLAQLLGVSWCSSLLWVNVKSSSVISVCPHKIAEAQSTHSAELNYLRLVFPTAQSPKQSGQKTAVVQCSVPACFLAAEAGTLSSNDCHYW